MSSFSPSSHPPLLKLPRELRDEIWELVLAPRIIIALPKLPTSNFFDVVGEHDRFGENLYYPELERDSNMRGAYHGDLHQYFDDRTDDWDPDEVPTCKNVFYKKYADLAWTLANQQIHEETSKILEKVTVVMRETIKNRQLQEPVRPAFLHLLSQGRVVFECGPYETVSFLLTSAPGTLACVRSLYIGQEMGIERMFDTRSGGTMYRLWEALDIRRIQRQRLGHEEVAGLAQLLRTHLPNLKELAFWARVEDYETFLDDDDEYSEDYDGYFDRPPAWDLLEDFCGLVNDGPLEVLHVMFAYTHEEPQFPSDGKKRPFATEASFQGLMDKHGIVMTRDEEGLKLAERRWTASGIGAIGTLRRVEERNV
ncbi:hypothetical protein GLAREA_03888 [Glarea lozoyensis ATCC 20868]|uniref:Uncharacterized protein n=1 Tax=Glarea lozoyensis (strain ATCC 20868 / MF5171) TaxID=1116229 RepID=S3DG00_GLAL2|nr:uncharacterized protein GLAREA_03888 [Glarea lozoyensis ATCC 20868]EPE30921.1 hypothetical protein GLAREA_03888 [Glarea lozoyensis ATCC 20868]